MISQMSAREKTLAFLVGGVVFLLINVVVIKFFMNQHAALKLSAADLQKKINDLKLQDQDRDFFRERDAWLTEKQPTMGDSQVAARQLSDNIKELARKNEVTIETPLTGQPKAGAQYTSLGAKVTAKGPWKAIFYLMQELQAPNQFIVLDPVELKVDITDKTLMRADLTVNRWYRP
jgi:hypothetical protein